MSPCRTTRRDPFTKEIASSLEPHGTEESYQGVLTSAFPTKCQAFSTLPLGLMKSARTLNVYHRSDFRPPTVYVPLFCPPPSTLVLSAKSEHVGRGLNRPTFQQTSH